MQEPPNEEIAKWDRWFAVAANNRAWALAELAALTAPEREEMLLAAHGSAYHWSRLGNDLNEARAEMLLGHVHALAGNGALALAYARRSFEYVTSREGADLEIAFAHAVLAHSAWAAEEVELYGAHYAEARRLGLAIANPVEKEIFQRTFARVPAPPG